MTGEKVSGGVTWGLLAAWAANDLEEIATMAGWLRTARPKLRKRLPWVPDRMWQRADLSQREVNTAIGLMGAVIAAAADGARTGGRSPFFGAVLVGFGLHGVVHLAQSAAYGGYTPGVATSPDRRHPVLALGAAPAASGGRPGRRGPGPGRRGGVPAGGRGGRARGGPRPGRTAYGGDRLRRRPRPRVRSRPLFAPPGVPPSPGRTPSRRRRGSARSADRAAGPRTPDRAASVRSCAPAR